MSQVFKRVLVLGSDGYGRAVESYRWPFLPSQLNVADFNLLVLDFAAIEGGANFVNASAFPTPERFARLLFGSHGLVVAVGDPANHFAWLESAGRLAVETKREVTWWLPVDLPTKREQGVVIEQKDDGWSFWFDQLDRYTWHFWQQPAVTTDTDRLNGYRAGLPGATNFAGQWEPLAQTNDGSPLGVNLTLFAGGGMQMDTANVVWLPPLPNVTHDEAIAQMLRVRFGVLSEQPKPDWLPGYRLPLEDQVGAVAKKAYAALENAQREAEEADAQFEHESRFGALLYEQGKDALEPVVREALAVLGVTVSEGTSDQEDAWLADPSGRTAIVEIKGRRGALKVDDVRQLYDWITAAAFDDASPKGLLIANTQLDLPPHERNEPVGANAVSLAARHGIAILLTTQLFEALRAEQDGELDKATFWDAVFSAGGVVDLPHISPT